MDTQLKIISLAKCLHGFGLDDLKQLLAISSKAVWAAGDDIFNEGEQGRDMFIICSGKVRIWRKNNGRKLSLASLSEGESFGEMGLVDAGKRSAGSTAVVDTVALRINYDRLNEAPAAATILYRNIAKALAERLTLANNIILFQSQSGATPPPLETIGSSRRIR